MAASSGKICSVFSGACAAISEGRAMAGSTQRSSAISACGTSVASCSYCSSVGAYVEGFGAYRKAGLVERGGLQGAEVAHPDGVGGQADFFVHFTAGGL